jgi:hypothetical protein
MIATARSWVQQWLHVFWRDTPYFALERAKTPLMSIHLIINEDMLSCP